MLGGSSSINGLLYVRGQAQDFDHWRQLGNQGWAWDDVLPLFKRAEHWEGAKSEDRGTDGPLNVSESELPAILSMRGSMQQNMQGIHTIVTTQREPGRRRPLSNDDAKRQTLQFSHNLSKANPKAQKSVNLHRRQNKQSGI